MNSYTIVFLVTVLFYQSSGYTITGDEDDEFDYDNIAMEMGDSEEKHVCFMSATLEGCSRGDVIEINTETESNEKVTVKDKQTRACLKTKCIGDKRELRLSNKVEIGGESVSIIVEAKPDIFDQDSKVGKLFSDEKKCLGSSEKPVVTVTCEKQEKAPTIMAYEQQAEGAFDETEPQDLEDIEPIVVTEEGTIQERAYFTMNGSEIEIQDTQNGMQNKATYQFNNWFHGCLNVQCGNRNGLFWVISMHFNGYKDRLFHFRCKRATNRNFNHCYWTGYMNGWDKPLFAQCNADYILNGVYSVFHGGVRDRVYRLLCCRAPHHYTRRCQLTGYINGFRGLMNYGVHGRRVFNGLFSYHENAPEDRIWKISSCDYQ